MLVGCSWQFSAEISRHAPLYRYRRIQVGNPEKNSKLKQQRKNENTRTPAPHSSIRPSTRDATSTIRVHPTRNTPEALIDPRQRPWHNDEVRFKVYDTRKSIRLVMRDDFDLKLNPSRLQVELARTAGRCWRHGPQGVRTVQCPQACTPSLRRRVSRRPFVEEIEITY